MGCSGQTETLYIDNKR